jgi:hypothetical protein
MAPRWGADAPAVTPDIAARYKKLYNSWFPVTKQIKDLRATYGLAALNASMHAGEDPGPDQELPPDTGDPLRDYEGKMLDLSMGADPGPDQELPPDTGDPLRDFEGHMLDISMGAAPGVGAVVNGLLNITAIADWLSRCGASDKAFATEVCAALKKYGHADTCKWARKSPANLQKAVTAALTSGPPASSPELRAAIVSALSRHGATVSTAVAAPTGRRGDLAAGFGQQQHRRLG